MKHLRKVWALCLALCVLSGCRAARETERESSPASVTETKMQTEIELTVEPQTEPTAARAQDLPPVDIDLSQMPQNLMYAQVYEILYNPEQFLGKSVRITGPYSASADPETGEIHRACLIRDATACCTQGMEFELADDTQTLPQEDEIFTVSGGFDTYMSGPFLYCVLRNAKIES